MPRASACSRNDRAGSKFGEPVPHNSKANHKHTRMIAEPLSKSPARAKPAPREVITSRCDPRAKSPPENHSVRAFKRGAHCTKVHVRRRIIAPESRNFPQNLRFSTPRRLRVFPAAEDKYQSYWPRNPSALTICVNAKIAADFSPENKRFRATQKAGQRYFSVDR